MKKDKKVVILIPTHRPTLKKSDLVSLASHKKYLSKYDTYFVVPQRISAKAFTARGYKVKKVDNNFFGTLRKVNESLLHKKFYEYFKEYDYMLLYQLDVVVFSDQLMKWVNSGYDFIGPPWFRPVIGYLSHKKGYPHSGANGGFSLRNIKKFINIVNIVQQQATRTSKNPQTRKMWFLKALLTGQSHKIWLNAPAVDYPFNEDGFWSLEAPKYDPTFRVASFEKALQFGFERYPQRCFALNKHKLPFGAHAWEKHNPEFWEPFLIDYRSLSKDKQNHS